MSTPITIYSADSQARQFREVLGAMVHGMLHSRYVAYRLARRDIKNSYSASALGMVWDLLDPLVLAGIFYYLMHMRLISTEGLGMPPSVFVVYGMMLYQTYVEALVMSTDMMNRSKGMLSHLKIAPEAIILSVFYRVGFNSLFRIAVMLFFSLVAGVFSPVGFLKFLLLFPLIILWGMAPGVFLAPFNAIYSDVGRLIRLLVMPMRFLAPVIYAIPAGSLLERLQIINPFTMILNNLRELAVNNTMVDLNATLIHGAILLLLGLAGWFLFHIAVPILAERS